MEAVYELMKSAAVAGFRICHIEGEEYPDHSWQRVTCHLHREDVSWSAFPLRVTFLPQEVSASESRRVLEEVRALPRRQLGTAMTVISRLGSRPERLLETDLPSPGEVRKLLIALGVAREPWLIIMDEPTNHLDLVSIQCLETALDDCPAALLLVSHDRRLLDRLTRMRWVLTVQEGGLGYCRVDG